MHFASAQNNCHPKCNRMTPKIESLIRYSGTGLGWPAKLTVTYWQDSIIKNLKRTLGFLKRSAIVSLFSFLFSSTESLLSSSASRVSKIFWSKLRLFTLAIQSRTSIASSRLPCRRSHLTSFQDIVLENGPFWDAQTISPWSGTWLIRSGWFWKPSTLEILVSRSNK